MYNSLVTKLSIDIYTADRQQAITATITYNRHEAHIFLIRILCLLRLKLFPVHYLTEILYLLLYFLFLIAAFIEIITNQ